MKLFLILGAINGFLAVALGAFGAHGLEGKIPEKYIKTWQTGVTYQMFHAGGLFVIAFLIDKLGNIGQLTAAGWLFFIGIILFSGSLYVLSVTQISVLGAITPLGGLSFLGGWLLIGYIAIRHL
ncbi:DUF423 domain-containing protein [Metabacillus malikii]|uniref:Uncharacterized membrane protein YgdD (TMEM256/DUF423 family) n=1 Tax=Metabacillus malikii TaxID=1504265 RepID=A0ABT9ZIV2_9BACI|nr:DUF423 domain-containing protein [Metabacillus malikii]MDQ0232213.1 uncharacterized membrane protein YgdD (TMEM256/DUF423 family) [Metabacillus malikii]